MNNSGFPMSTKLASIIVPCYNQAEYLDQCLQSVLSQSYNNWECIIVNDGSTDFTDEVVDKWLKKDVRFRYFSKENGGLSSARNKGLDEVRGSYVQFLDSDDCLSVSKLEKSVHFMETQIVCDVKMIISNFRMFFDINNPLLPYCKLSQELLNYESVLYDWEDSFTIPIHCGFFDISVFNDFRFLEVLKSKEDWVMWVVLFKNNKARFIEESLAYYRHNPKSITNSKNLLIDYLNALRYFKTILSSLEYDKLQEKLIARFYNTGLLLQRENIKIKNSNEYRLGKFLKKVATKSRLLFVFRILMKSKFISKRLRS